MKKRPKIVAVRKAGPRHRVITVHGSASGHGYQTSPCATCPWRKDAVGEFPAEAFRCSAHTAEDMSMTTFACHSSGSKRPMDCAGFLSKGSDHNLRARLNRMRGVYKKPITDGGHELHENYREMAIANGVSPNDPAIQKCR